MHVPDSKALAISANTSKLLMLAYVNRSSLDCTCALINNTHSQCPTQLMLYWFIAN